MNGISLREVCRFPETDPFFDSIDPGPADVLEGSGSCLRHDFLNGRSVNPTADILNEVALSSISSGSFFSSKQERERNEILEKIRGHIIVQEGSIEVGNLKMKGNLHEARIIDLSNLPLSLLAQNRQRLFNDATENQETEIKEFILIVFNAAIRKKEQNDHFSILEQFNQKGKLTVEQIEKIKNAMESTLDLLNTGNLSLTIENSETSSPKSLKKEEVSHSEKPFNQTKWIFPQKGFSFAFPPKNTTNLEKHFNQADKSNGLLTSSNNDNAIADGMKGADVAHADPSSSGRKIQKKRRKNSRQNPLFPEEMQSAILKEIGFHLPLRLTEDLIDKENLTFKMEIDGKKIETLERFAQHCAKKIYKGICKLFYVTQTEKFILFVLKGAIRRRNGRSDSILSQWHVKLNAVCVERVKKLMELLQLLFVNKQLHISIKTHSDSQIANGIEDAGNLSG